MARGLSPSPSCFGDRGSMRGIARRGNRVIGEVPACEVRGMLKAMRRNVCDTRIRGAPHIPADRLGERSLGDVKRGGCDVLFSAVDIDIGIKFGRWILDMVTTGRFNVGSLFAIVVRAAPVFAMHVARNLLIPKASWQDGAPLSLVARPMYLPGSGQLVPRLSDS